MFKKITNAGRSDDRPVFSLFLFIIVTSLSFALGACEMQSQRIAPFQGQIANLPDSCSTSGIIIYDEDSDGVFSDTTYFDTDAFGNFDGMLFYSTSATIRAPLMRKPVRILAPDLGIDTFLDVDVYLKSHEFQIDPTDFGLIYCAQTLLDSLAGLSADTESTYDSTDIRDSLD